MNIEELNSCFESITPTKDQKDKMLSGIMKAKAQPVKTIKLYRYVSAAAAVIAIGIFVGVYSNMNTNIDVTENVALGTKTNKVQDATETDVTSETNKTIDEKIQDFETNNKTNIISDIKNEYIGNDEKMSENYEVALEVKDEDILPSAPQEDKAVAESTILEDYEDNTPIAPTDSAYIPASGGGGGGASGGGSASYTRTKSLTLNDIKSNETYSLLLPTTFVEGFEFTGATETDKTMYAYFSSKDGRFMEISVAKKDGLKIYQQIISPSQVADITTDGYMDFAVDCGDYYVVYYVESNNSSEVYEMVTSSAYFK